MQHQAARMAATAIACILAAGAGGWVRACRRRRTGWRMQLRVACEPGLGCSTSSSASSSIVCVHVLSQETRACQEQLAGLCSLLLREEKLLGLDCEWQPETKGQRSNVAVVQISSRTDCILLQALYLGDPAKSPSAAAASEGAPSAAEGLLHPSSMLGASEPAAFFPEPLRALLEDPTVIKAGVGIHEDVRRLQRDFGIQVRGALDVRLAVQVLAPHLLSGGSSLQALAATLLGVVADKREQCSEWQRRRLSRGQVAYAARDAWISQRLVISLHGHLEELSSAGAAGNGESSSGGAAEEAGRGEGSTSFGGPAAAAAAVAAVEEQEGQEEGTGGKSAGGASRSLFETFSFLLDQLGKARGSSPTSTPRSRRGNCGERGADGGNGGSGRGGSRSKALKPANMPTRKSELYENCKLLAPDGSVLCTCGKKKIQWYLDRGLADVVDPEPLTAKLRFEPRGRGNVDDKYYLSDKRNRCCVCGKEQDLLRHNIVPHCYRCFFPNHMKSHLSHDVVLLCQACQIACCRRDQVRMAALGVEHNAPLVRDNQKYEQDAVLCGIKSAARALCMDGKVSLPPERRAHLQELVLQHFGAAELTSELLQQAASLQDRKVNTEWRSHASLVVERLLETGAVEEFVKSWRRHFLELMAPKFLPPHWDVNSRVSNSDAPITSQQATLSRSSSCSRGSGQDGP